MDQELIREVGRALHLMAEALANPKKITDDLVEIWCLVLTSAGVKAEEVLPATARLIQTATFFPAPADFLKALRPAEDLEAAKELAWQRVLTCCREFGANASLTAADVEGDTAALWAVERFGWERLCTSEDEPKFKRAEFVRLYHVAREEGMSLKYLTGRMERQNSLNGRDLNPILVGRPDWKALPMRHLPQLGAGDGNEGRELVLAGVGRDMPGDEEERAA